MQAPAGDGKHLPGARQGKCCLSRSATILENYCHTVLPPLVQPNAWPARNRAGATHSSPTKEAPRPQGSLTAARTAGDGRVAPLFKHVFPPAAAPSLAFIGLLWKSIRNTQFELQARHPLAAVPTMPRSASVGVGRCTNAGEPARPLLASVQAQCSATRTGMRCARARNRRVSTPDSLLLPTAPVCWQTTRAPCVRAGTPCCHGSYRPASTALEGGFHPRTRAAAGQVGGARAGRPRAAAAGRRRHGRRRGRVLRGAGACRPARALHALPGAPPLQNVLLTSC